ncbi:siderophore-interacting protein [Blastococcus sp. MG754426]|uniref:siderophore-interacting protein n=1 Tax=unclassified Blastococcus TaxID=2619396 RepID=UPI001EF033F3|nr:MULTISPECIES: siderophore-interacting protein [unclassified Blastococcus]MCF6509576.1 siderophore-interacting protein [Blastococcus sp. MG754426]MCF6514236.1 siderophore-interacting protein [Blastococcus sp. MG754427]MCF6737381.1 siderophore-interacting protein [Blastococcus sp. KM273129]
MSEPQRDGDGRPRRKKALRTGEVVRTSWLTPHMVRVVLGGEGLAGFPESELTDRYVKLLFPPAGASYAVPYDPDQVRAELPADQWPVTRTYTVRAWDAAAGELTIDFVHHGDEGLAGPWAAAARPGDRIQLLGPGGAYTPRPDADWHLLAGDESALPAIAAALEGLPAGARALVFVEVAGPEEEQGDLAAGPGVDVRWLHRGASLPGELLVHAVRATTLPAGDGHVFVHGEAHAVRELRRHLRAERGLDPAWTSISGYWRRGDTEDRWQSGKREWNAALEAEDAAVAR